MTHPYIGMTGSTPEVNGRIVAIGNGVRWCAFSEGYVPCVVAVLLNGPAHFEVPLENLTVDHAEATSRLTGK